MPGIESFRRAKLTVSTWQMAELLYHFTINPESHSAPTQELAHIDGLDIGRVNWELVFLTIFIVDLILRSDAVREKYGQKAHAILLQYLSFFKAQTQTDGTEKQFLHLLNARGNTYGKIMSNYAPGYPTKPPFQIAEFIADQCSAPNKPILIMVVLSHFGSLFQAVRHLIDSHAIE